MWRTAKEEASYKSSFYEASSFGDKPSLFISSLILRIRSMWSSRLLTHLQTFHFLLWTVWGNVQLSCERSLNMLEKGAFFLSSPGMPVWCTLEGSGPENQRLQPIPKSSSVTRAAQAAQSCYFSVRSQIGFLINNFYLKFQKISRNSISIRLSYHTLQVT